MLPSQCRAARGLLDWTQERLADASGVSVGAIRNFEAGITNPMRANLAALKSALESGGIVFIDENGGGPGVRLRK